MVIPGVLSPCGVLALGRRELKRQVTDRRFHARLKAVDGARSVSREGALVSISVPLGIASSSNPYGRAGMIQFPPDN